METPIIVALVAAGTSLLVTGPIGIYISRRTLSRSGARLLTDLQILEKAKALNLPADQLTAIQTRVAKMVEKHAGTPIG